MLYIEYEFIIHTPAKCDNYDSFLGDACNYHYLSYALSLPGMLYVLTYIPLAKFMDVQVSRIK